jgi:molecular chaperone Hsp33
MNAPARRKRSAEILSGFTAEEVEESVEDGRIRVNCEFCSTAYDFDPDEFRTPVLN